MLAEFRQINKIESHIIVYILVCSICDRHFEWNSVILLPDFCPHCGTERKENGRKANRYGV